MSFRTRLFLTSACAAALTLAVATILMSRSVRTSLERQIDAGLANEARLAAETLSNRPVTTPEALHAEAVTLGRLIEARVTFVAPDGQVVGDSSVPFAELAAMDNHAGRPEIRQAGAEGIGRAIRYGTTVETGMMYVAVRIEQPAAPELAFVRLALPLTGIEPELAKVWRIALLAFGVALAAALLVAWTASALLARRADEMGTVARALDGPARELAGRVAELDADRARMAAILGGMIEGVLVVNEQGRVQLANGAARRMLKLQDAPEGRHYLEIVRHPDIAAQLGAALDGQTIEGRELTLPLDPGSVFIARGAPVSPQPGAARGAGAVLVLHDITDLRHADRVRRDFVANVSHELRTPLTAVRGYVEALLDGGIDARDSRRFIETIARHTLRMERLVRDLLRLARLDAGQEALDRIPCQVSSLLDGIETELADAIARREQRIERRIAPAAGEVMGDPAKLHDALRNLLENAINYAPEGSTIVLGSRREDDRVLITVDDSGPGIPTGDLGRVFERFYRVDKSRARTERDPGGTGLGLAIVKHLVELHGGKATAANRPEGGASFTVELPA